MAEEGEADDEVKTVADFDDEDDLVTEELAEIYRQQGLNDEAWRDLSQIKFAKSGKKCLLCRTYRRNSVRGEESLK